MKYDFPMIVLVCARRLAEYACRLPSRIRAAFICWANGIQHDGRVTFQGPTLIRTRRRGDIRLGSHVVFNANRKTNFVGLTGPTVLDTRHGGRIEVGEYSGFSSVVMSSKTQIKIGEHVKVGGNVRIFDHDFHALEWEKRRPPEDRQAIRSRAIEIGDDVFVGTNAVILKGTLIGARSIVAAGSVVFGLDIPPDSMVKGNPAEIVKIIR